MNRIPKTSLLLLVMLAVLSACTWSTTSSEQHSNVPHDLSPQAPDSDMADLVAGNNDFAWMLYRQVVSGEENLFYSPYSVSLALAMTYAGAAGDTAGQMAQALQFNLPAERLHPAFNKLALELAGRSAVEGVEPDSAFRLNVANSLWGQQGFSFEQAFLDTLARNYDAGMHLVDFEHDTEAARQAINDWVSKSTQERIKDIIPEGAVDALTRLVLANAIYFKAAWLYPFDAANTQTGAFHLTDGGSVDVPMMYEEKGLGYIKGEDYLAVELPYAGGQLSMLVLLPDTGGLAGFESRLNGGVVRGIVSAMTYTEVRLTLPKFRMEWSAELSTGMKALGMTDAFDPGSADFSGMDGARDLFISGILHKSFVSVDEQGTEAAAATAVIVGEAAMPSNPVEVKVDRPFLFLIRDNPTGAVLFIGRVTNPSGT
jgi:serpin B